MLVRNIMLKKKENPKELEMIQRILIERERERELAQEATQKEMEMRGATNKKSCKHYT